ncbi:PLAC8-domain-containing protein [Massarina eburnea CBS 473.64]|uniref:PLAC8-domain-containing protein n=1 Tax=Massarina eburnea CBS 473.64 TaxID=1395130 RepID=A0A6A6SHZ7_9PLEO|nr:PLAC8-domain-containing protein [Massarina eburnea CBS 473.64]
MDPRQTRQLPHSDDRQHQRFSWQSPPEIPPEQNDPGYQQPQHYTQRQPQPRLRIHSDENGQPHNRTFSYAQTPAEHIAFQYIPSPSDAPSVPRIPSPIDPGPASIYTAHHQATQPQPQPTYSSPAYPEIASVSPLSSNNRSSLSQYGPVSPVSEPQQVYTQQTEAQRHARNLSNLSPINTNLAHNTIPPMPPTPHAQPAGALPTKMPITPISPNSIKKEPLDHRTPTSPTSKASYAHEPYSPHGHTPTGNPLHAVFSPDSAHGPNGLDFSLHRPGQIAHPNMDLSTPGQKQSWKTSLCSCTPDFSTCLTGLFCPCILYGRTSYRLSQKSAKQDPTDLLSYEATNGHCAIMALSCGLWWLFPMLQRTRLRHMYKLEGGLLGDCVKGVCCCCCVAVQNEREVKGREEAMRRWAGPAGNDVYGREGGMKYKPQN